MTLFGKDTKTYQNCKWKENYVDIILLVNYLKALFIQQDIELISVYICEYQRHPFDGNL